MENNERRYTLYMKVGDDEVSASADDAGFVREMLEEFKCLHLGKPRTVSLAELVSEKAAPKDVVDADFIELYKKVRPKKGVDKALLYLYYLHQRGETKGVRPREIVRAIATTGDRAPSAISTSLGYMRRIGIVDMKDRFWFITEKGAERVERKLLK
ncbi:MAG: hypothetical protein ABIM74_07490 [candidate division WOR-3 bacterium]